METPTNAAQPDHRVHFYFGWSGHSDPQNAKLKALIESYEGVMEGDFMSPRGVFEPDKADRFMAYLESASGSHWDFKHLWNLTERAPSRAAIQWVPINSSEANSRSFVYPVEGGWLVQTVLYGTVQEEIRDGGHKMGTRQVSAPIRTETVFAPGPHAFVFDRATRAKYKIPPDLNPSP